MSAAGFHADLDRDGRTLLVAFGGLLNQIGEIPVFEFMSLVEAEDPAAKRLFLRDLHQVWYQRGVEGAGDTVPQVAEWLGALTSRTAAERVVMVGASAGGFAAILFGALAGATEVHAFGPQTFLDRPRRVRYRDFRFAPQIKALRADRAADRRFFDVRPSLAAAPEPPRVVIHFSSHDRLDVRHARRLERLPTVELRPYPFDDHNVVGKLRERGELPRLLDEILSGR
jgi:pimeloyl-ACP methyl ester carboxylesterase